MRYVVYGTGAVGGVVAARLSLAARPVTLIARGEHLARIRGHGLVLDAAEGRHVVRAPASDTAADVEWTEDTVVLLAVKSQQTAAALDDLVPHLPAGTPVVCLQNGVANEPAVLRRVADTYAITVMLPSTHLEPGVVVQTSHPVPGILDIGRFPSGTDAVTEAVSVDLRAAGFESEQRPDIMAWKHRKLLLNLGNGIDAVCAPGPEADRLEELARLEGEAVLEASGRAVVSAAADRARRGNLLEPRANGAPPRGGSTWQSLTRGGGVEIDYLAGEVVLLGRLHAVATPVNELVQRATLETAHSGAEARSLDAAALLTELGRAGG